MYIFSNIQTTYKNQLMNDSVLVSKLFSLLHQISFLRRHCNLKKSFNFVSREITHLSSFESDLVFVWNELLKYENSTNNYNKQSIKYRLTY